MQNSVASGRWIRHAARVFITCLACSLPVLAGNAPGITNFDRVDAHVYRGGQPTAEGLAYLAGLGVKTVIDLRESDARAATEAQQVIADGMRYVNVPMTGLTPPTDAEISKLLMMLEDNTTGPVFVHCRRGADRTGAVIAAYHIEHDKWDNSRALADAKAHSMSPFQGPRHNFIRQFHARVMEAAAPAVAALN
ncbi:MAG TPA: tyrosine-protein phosphatase [Bryobacteraceae bacterium]|jgi:protein-tyrosine phosphatase|nr:tyrosine-protein phosphatase [Bryobacteraceae bacterium]